MGSQAPQQRGAILMPGSTLQYSVPTYECPQQATRGRPQPPTYSQYIIPLSRWTGGEIWCANLQGTVQLQSGSPRGVLKSIVMPYTRFNARLPHAVLPWVGNRYVLGAFHIRDDWRLKDSDSDFLESLGFRLHSRDRATHDPYSTAH